MTDDAKEKALDFVNEQFTSSGYQLYTLEEASISDLIWGFTLAVIRYETDIKDVQGQYERFRQEVSDAVEKHQAGMYLKDTELDRFIIAKPDHIRSAALDIGVSWGPNDSDSFRAALAKRGGRIVFDI